MQVHEVEQEEKLFGDLVADHLELRAEHLFKKVLLLLHVRVGSDNGLLSEELHRRLFSTTQVRRAEALNNLTLGTSTEVTSAVEDGQSILHIIGKHLHMQALRDQLIGHLATTGVETLLEDLGVELLRILTFTEEESVSFRDPVVEQLPSFLEVKAQLVRV